MSDSLEAWRKTGKTTEAVKMFMNPKDKEDVLLKTRDEDPLRSEERGLEILVAYMDMYPNEPKEMVGKEFRIEIEIMPGYTFEGIIDGIWKKDGLFLMEDKTTSRLGDSFFKAQKRNAQIRWYLWGANEYGFFKDEPPKALINAIYIHKTNQRFERDVLILSKKMVAGYRDEILDWINHIELTKDSDIFPRHRANCSAFGECDFYSFCFLKGDVREKIIASDFRERENHTE
jgi:hypothetical protein